MRSKAMVGQRRNFIVPTNHRRLHTLSRSLTAISILQAA
jgi:hypothetical protein